MTKVNGGRKDAKLHGGMIARLLEASARSRQGSRRSALVTIAGRDEPPDRGLRESKTGRRVAPCARARERRGWCEGRAARRPW
jgi:hypothetical protein